MHLLILLDPVPDHKIDDRFDVLRTGTKRQSIDKIRSTLEHQHTEQFIDEGLRRRNVLEIENYFDTRLNELFQLFAQS